MLTASEVVERAFAAYASGDIAGMLELVDADLEWTYLDPALAYPRPKACHGRDELEGVLTHLAEHGTRFLVGEVRARGNKVMAELRVPVHSHDPELLEVEDRWNVVTAEGGRIVKLRDFRTRLGALRFLNRDADA